MSSELLAGHRRLVVKIGSALLIDARGRLNLDWVNGLLDDVAEWCGEGRQLLLVSSGSVALGSAGLGIDRRRARLEELQAAAAAGQIRLARAYQELLEQRGLAVAQILPTPDDTEIRRRSQCARHARKTAGAGRGAGYQRERHGGDG
ncbi:MAG: hypothetical protein U5K76_08160 [Woeseiaceae bacterium]|nr:hypothetical protein [Woeseiaceae bacterium]